MGWGFVWLMVVLKIPIVLLLWLVWWAVRQTPEEDGSARGDDGGTQVVDARDPRHPRPPFTPGPRRRGPHGDGPLAAPARVRTHARRAREREH